MALAERELKVAVRVEGEDLVRVAVGEEDQVVVGDRHEVDVGDPALAPRPDEGAAGIEDQNRRVRASMADMDEALRIDDEVADEAEGRVVGRLAPPSLDPVAPVAECDDEMFIHHACLP